MKPATINHKGTVDSCGPPKPTGSCRCAPGACRAKFRRGCPRSGRSVRLRSWCPCPRFQAQCLEATLKGRMLSFPRCCGGSVVQVQHAVSSPCPCSCFVGLIIMHTSVQQLNESWAWTWQALGIARLEAYVRLHNNHASLWPPRFNKLSNAGATNCLAAKSTEFV